MRPDMLKQQILAAAAYPLIVFPLAIIWHLVLFKDRYMSFGYFEGEPNIAVGLASMGIQGAVLAAIYPMFRFGRSGLRRAVTFAALLGLFFLDKPCAGAGGQAKRAASRYVHLDGDTLSVFAVRPVRTGPGLDFSRGRANNSHVRLRH